MHKIILTIFFILFAVIYDARRSFAQEKFNLPPSDKYPNDSWVEEIPIVCNETDIVDTFLKSKGWYMTKAYAGREGASANGTPVFVISQYKHPKIKDSIIETITVPSGESCILYQGFDGKDGNEKA